MKGKRRFPNPKKRFHRRTWEIYWYWDKIRYSVFAQASDKDDDLAVEADRRKLAAALSSDDLEFPEKYANAPAVLKYVGVRNNTRSAEMEKPTAWLESYRKNIEQECGEEWARSSQSFLKRLQAKSEGNLSKVSKALANDFLEDVHKGHAAGTRNRALAACNRFFKWAIATERMKKNPFAGIKQLREKRKLEIVYCTREERDRIPETPSPPKARRTKLFLTMW